MYTTIQQCSTCSLCRPWTNHDKCNLQNSKHRHLPLGIRSYGVFDLSIQNDFVINATLNYSEPSSDTVSVILSNVNLTVLIPLPILFPVYSKIVFNPKHAFKLKRSVLTCLLYTYVLCIQIV